MVCPPDRRLILPPKFVVSLPLSGKANPSNFAAKLKRVGGHPVPHLEVERIPEDAL
jgi:hypothetical protein